MTYFIISCVYSLSAIYWRSLRLLDLKKYVFIDFVLEKKGEGGVEGEGGREGEEGERKKERERKKY